MWRPKETKKNDRIYYLSGPHGSGKSTLVTRLSDIRELQVSEQFAHLESLQGMVERAIWRVALHAIEHRMNLERVAKNPDQILIGDRCYVDDLVYWAAFAKYGWITEEQRSRYVRLTRETYRATRTPTPMNVIMLTPPLNWNINRIIERQQATGEVKWNEDDFGYASAVNAAFHTYAALPHMENLLQVSETDIDARIATIREWVLPQRRVQAVNLVEAGRTTYRSHGGTD